ncbi:hypothetical protein BDA99DRAFT_533875 [Phascolomyces articulosus]|uniref:Uncharacterized protein n=1 Tax=Phascolomyces articulosus TaxID=60185 RepID=A0AAD5KPX3_9FUNG|nr:hypothetical protein BDA99DRAFT_533875 [Phascolomyces articulosus]
MRCLSVLYLYDYLVFNSQDFYQLLNLIAQRSKPSELYIKSIRCVDDNVMEMCSRIQSLKYLTFEHVRVDDIIDMQQQAFVQRVPRLLNLERLILYNMDLTMNDWRCIMINMKESEYETYSPPMLRSFDMDVIAMTKFVPDKHYTIIYSVEYHSISCSS